MLTNQDQSAQTRLFAINLATQDPSRVTGIISLHPAIEFGRAESIQAEKELLESGKAVSQEEQEGKAATQIVDLAITAAIEEYNVLQGVVKVSVVPVRRDDIVAMGPMEFNRRKEFVEVNFSAAPSKLEENGRARTVNYLTNTVQSCLESEYVSADAYGPLAAKVEIATQALNALKDEELDDAPLRNKLYASRAKAARTYQAFRLLIQSALQFSQSPHTIDQFILAEVKKSAPAKSQEVETILTQDAAADAALTPTLPTTVSATVQ
ncbi:MAG: hypothetical protein HUU55_04955 [Myxococcales bacterium]|nr:hypothetical protein [Myxococcales bacterium]